MDIEAAAEERYPEYVADHAGRQEDRRMGFIEGAEWARKQTLEEVLQAAEDNRVILKTVRNGYTVEEYGDPLVRISVLRALGSPLTRGDTQ